MPLLTGLAALAAKVASASTVAQVAAGVGISVAGVTGAGFTGVLPGPVQDGVAGALEVVTPFDVPDSGDDASFSRSAVDGADETDDSGADSPGDLDDSGHHSGGDDDSADDSSGRGSGHDEGDDSFRHGSDDD